MIDNFRFGDSSLSSASLFWIYLNSCMIYRRVLCAVESEIVEIVARLPNGDDGKEESGCDFKGKCELF